MSYYWQCDCGFFTGVGDSDTCACCGKEIPCTPLGILEPQRELTEQEKADLRAEFQRLTASVRQGDIQVLPTPLEVQRVALRPGDRLVIHIDRGLSPKEYDAVWGAVDRWAPGVPVLILQDGLTLGVVGPDDTAQAERERRIQAIPDRMEARDAALKAETGQGIAQRKEIMDKIGPMRLREFEPDAPTVVDGAGRTHSAPRAQGAASAQGEASAPGGGEKRTIGGG